MKRVGLLRLVKWGDPSGIAHETIILRDRRGHAVARISGHGVELETVQDLAGDGAPDAVLRAWSGGAHGGFVYYVYSTGPLPRCLLAYYKKDGDGDDDLANCSDFAVKDLDGGHKEIVSWYDGFAYGGEVFNWASSYGGSARVPIVLGLRRGRYVDITCQCRRWLRRKLAEAREHFLDGLDEAGAEGLTGDRAQGMIEYYAVALLLYDRDTARGMVTRHLARKGRTFFLKHCGLIERVVAQRSERYAYPPAYSRGQAFASDALPPPDTDAGSGVGSGAEEHHEAAAR